VRCDRGSRITDNTPRGEHEGTPAERFKSLATNLLSRGVHAKLVQELLGHATISITLNTYSHVLPGRDDGLADAMGDALG
jgi:integrase